MTSRIALLATAACLLFAGSAHAATFTSSGGLIAEAPGSDDFKAASVYPLPIAVSGLSGPVSKVTVTLNRLLASDPSYLDFLVVAPNGTAVLVMSDAAAYGPGTAENHVTIVFDQSFPTTIPTAPLNTADNQTVYFKPTNGESPEVFPNLPPNLDTTSTDLTRFNGISPNGEWKLYAIHSYAFGYRYGTIDSWSLDITTAPDTTPPVFSRPAVSGRTIGFDLSEAGSLQFRVDRISAGVKVKGKCLAPKKGRKGKRCTRYVPLPGAIDTTGVAGANSFAWNGRIGAKKLAPGKYRLTGLATDTAGNQSPPQKFTVTIKKPKKKKKKN